MTFSASPGLPQVNKLPSGPGHSVVTGTGEHLCQRCGKQAPAAQEAVFDRPGRDAIATPRSQHVRRRRPRRGHRHPRGHHPKHPKANAHCERVIGTLHREILDHILIVNPTHAHHVLTDTPTSRTQPHQYTMDGRARVRIAPAWTSPDQIHRLSECGPVGNSLSKAINVGGLYGDGFHMTQVRIVMDDASAASLYRWLAQDREVTRDVALSLGEGRPEDMGGALEVINVVLSNSIALTSLITSLATWRASRRPPVKVVVERGNIRVAIEGDSSEEVESLVKALEEGP